MEVLSREYLINQGECCGEGCLMCPYEPENKKGETNINYYMYIFFNFHLL